MLEHRLGILYCPFLHFASTIIDEVSVKCNQIINVMGNRIVQKVKFSLRAKFTQQNEKQMTNHTLFVTCIHKPLKHKLECKKLKMIMMVRSVQMLVS